MTAYQIPQFLDSGEKIFLGMNIRQFCYALVGFLICVVIYSWVFPVFGQFSWLLIAPIALFTFFLAMGKYNGRDAEVYVMKSILFFTKPRIMVYSREPILYEINQKLSALNYNKKVKEIKEKSASKSLVDGDMIDLFRKQNVKTQTKIIQRLGRYLDQSNMNIGSKVASKELEIERHRYLLSQINKRKEILKNKNKVNKK